MKKVFEFICEISASGKRLDIFLFEKNKEYLYQEQFNFNMK